MILAVGTFSSCSKDDDDCKAESKLDGTWIVDGGPDILITFDGNSGTTGEDSYVGPFTWSLDTCDKCMFTGTMNVGGYILLVSGTFLSDDSIEMIIDGYPVSLIRQ